MTLASQFLNLGLGGAAKAGPICGESRRDRIRRRRSKKRKKSVVGGDKSETPSPGVLQIGANGENSLDKF